jgi:hypothetical protein
LVFANAVEQACNQVTYFFPFCFLKDFLRPFRGCFFVDNRPQSFHHGHRMFMLPDISPKVQADSSSDISQIA